MKRFFCDCDFLGTMEVRASRGRFSSMRLSKGFHLCWCTSALFCRGVEGSWVANPANRVEIGNAVYYPRVVIFFSLTEAPLPDPTPTPPNTRKRTRNRPETELKRSRNGAKWSQNGAKRSFSGWDGRGVCRGRWGGGVVREKVTTQGTLPYLKYYGE